MTEERPDTPPDPHAQLGLCAACGLRTEEAVKWIDGKPYHPGCEPPMTLIDALAVLACTEALGKRDHSELKRRARAVVDQHAERWVG